MCVCVFVCVCMCVCVCFCVFVRVLVCMFNLHTQAAHYSPTGRVTTARQCGHCSQLVGHSSNGVFGQTEGSHLSNKHQLCIEGDNF